MNHARDQAFAAAARTLGHAFDGELKLGGRYAPLVRHNDVFYISGQVPRVGDQVVVTGRVGADVDLARAQLAARICVMRNLALLQRALGSLEHVRAILRMTVYVQCTESFTQQSEVGDGASDLLISILGPEAAHSRTSVGVLQLPKNASVEIDMVAVGQEPVQHLP